MKFDNQCEAVIRCAVAKSMYMNNIYVTPEHILYAMTGEKEFIHVLKSMGGSLEELDGDLEEFFQEMLPKKAEEKESEQAEVSAGFTSVIEIAAESARGSERGAVGLQHLLWGIFEQQESFAVYFLEKQVGDKEEFIFRLQEALENKENGAAPYDDEQPVWSHCATRLNDDIAKHNPLIGRDKEMERAIQILCRKDKNNPLFIGESGVGKTAMAYGLAQRIEEGNVPEVLKNGQVFLLDLSSLVAGTQYRGELEKRMKAVMESFLEEECPIVVLDEIHHLVGAGGLSGNSMDASGMLKPYFEDGSIRFVGTTTFAEYKKYFSQNGTLLRRFRNVEIKEPNEEEAVEILCGLKKQYERFHGVRYGKGVEEYAVSLSRRFINDRFLPDKAIDLLDEAGAYRKLHPVTDKKTQSVDKKVIEQVLSVACNIPLQTAERSEVERLKTLFADITGQVFGQNDAVQKIVDAICMSRAGLLDENKPIASFLFVGPTGVGKTEVAKVLAKELGIQLVRFDMSEYAEKHTVAKLIGSPAGYVGYEEGGLLTDAIRKAPHCVLLLDEIEKAHPDIYNVLLQVMDYASLTDNKGQKADFKNVIIIMTSNAGARRIGKQKMGFGEGTFDDSTMLEEVKKVFAPEFRNRLSAVVTFNHMSREMAELILDKKLIELQEKLSLKKVSLTLHKEARAHILEKGITREYGAREMERILNSEIKPLLVNELLFGKLQKGGSAVVSVKERKFVLKAGKKSAT